MKNKLPPFIEVYRALIAALSINAMEEALDQSNADLITLLADQPKDLGFNVEMQPVSETRNKFSMLASCGQGAGGLLLVEHTDTVPSDDGHWTCDSFTLTEHDSELYGLGTADMESFFAFILDTLYDVDVTRLAKPLYILATADGEISMTRAHCFAETITLRPNCAIVSEPTSLQPVHAHKGHISNATRIQGQSDHSDDSVRGVNAIELIRGAIGHILQLRDNLKERYHYDTFTVLHPVLNLGHIHGGDASNRICVCYELHMDIHPLLGMTLNGPNGLFSDTLTPVSKRWPGRLTIDELYPPTPGYEYPPNHKLVEVVEKLFGTKTEVMNYCIEAPFIQALCPMLVLGPGSISQTHQPDEYLGTRFIKPIRKLVTQVIHHFYWC